LEEDDGHKSIDISIRWALMDIEVDGKQHIHSGKQIYTDSLRAEYSSDDGYYTHRVSNAEIDNDVNSVARAIAEAARKRYKAIKKKEVPRSNKSTMKMVVILGVIILLAIIIVFTFSRQYSNSDYICSYDAYNCADFNTRAEAQAVMKYCGNDDIHYLDGDDDGIACESLP